MKLRELMRYIEHNQKVILNHGIWTEEFRGTARQINLIAFGDREIEYIYIDNDIYTRDYLKIQLKRVQQ